MIKKGTRFHRERTCSLICYDNEKRKKKRQLKLNLSAGKKEKKIENIKMQNQNGVRRRIADDDLSNELRHRLTCEKRKRKIVQESLVIKSCRLGTIQISKCALNIL